MVLNNKNKENDFLDLDKSFYYYHDDDDDLK